MKLSIRGAALAAGTTWGAAMLLIASANSACGYGGAFLTMMDGLYPGFAHDGTVWSVVVGTLYGLLDGLIAGAAFAWLYNRFSG